MDEGSGLLSGQLIRKDISAHKDLVVIKPLCNSFFSLWAQPYLDIDIAWIFDVVSNAIGYLVSYLYRRTDHQNEPKNPALDTKQLGNLFCFLLLNKLQ